MKTATYFYVVTALAAAGAFEDQRLAACTERHRIKLNIPQLRNSTSLLEDALRIQATGVVIEMVFGWPNRKHLNLARKALSKNLRVWFYWPKEQALEFVDEERHASHSRLWAYVKLTMLSSRLLERSHQLAGRYAPHRIRPLLKSILAFMQRVKARLMSNSVNGLTPVYKSDVNQMLVKEFERLLDRLIVNASPTYFSFDQSVPDASKPIAGTGLYLRTDFWAPIKTGGSYGHTCYVAKELAATTESFICFMANRFSLLDEMGLKQHIMPMPSTTCDEISIIRANGRYYDYLEKAIYKLQPAYIYERICLGNFVGARLSQEFKIPYIIEYNGSEISMRRSFDTGEFKYEQFFLKAEEAAFKQAALISVISDAVRDDLLRRGVSHEKILVNPNGVDLTAYAPMEENMRRLLRAKLGFLETDRVVGFIGTFGGWHGIDVLAKAIPEICNRDEQVKFLLIGDGNFKHLIDDSIKKHRLESRVICTGRVAHTHGAELLGACDIYVSPHSSHMVDGRFFGSPTKLFEYMAMGGGIVGSDLEQIGEVLSPAIRATNITEASGITRERSILCMPGDVAEFVEAVLFIAKHPDVAAILGKNAREAVLNNYTWQKHIAKLWGFAATYDVVKNT